MSEQALDISWQAICKVLAVGLCLYGLFLARDVALWLCFALVVTILLEPGIIFLTRLRLPRIVAVILVYSSILFLIGGAMWLVAPVFIFEMGQLTQNLPGYFDAINPLLHTVGIEVAKDFQSFSSNILATAKDSSESIVKAVVNFFGGLYSTFIIFTFAFFVSLEHGSINRFLYLLAPKDQEERVAQMLERAQEQVAGWFVVRLLACLLVGVLSFIVFVLLGVKFAFMLAVIGGILNFVPYIGPSIAFAITALFVGVADSWLAAAYVSVALLVIQELENKFLTPVLMKRFIDLPPVLVLAALLAGHAVFGFLGTIFAVPVFGIVYEFLHEYLHRKKQTN